MISILFVLPKTTLGGTEMQMLYLLKNIDKTKFDVYLVILYENSQLKKEVQIFQEENNLQPYLDG